jgi:hypothetical protein
VACGVVRVLRPVSGESEIMVVTPARRGGQHRIGHLRDEPISRHELALSDVILERARGRVRQLFYRMFWRLR